MASFPVSDMNKLVVHPAGGMSWSNKGLIVKRPSFPKGATPAHLRQYTERFSNAARECRSAMSGLKGAEKVSAFNACIGSQLG